ncbi:aldehyde dehydrogenase family protein [Azospirillum sp. RWY-5-1]|uniref:Aldehyde dehydrogenase family protein n=1 Tax=Azospirillum oleiclasticum TaxID=2735135 RepID=A0ABX2T8G1_9PROT|nr:aldehyde dehydrogenase family protein [Azospirillum oleiclasticum]NYZ12333.1 aldehyde dehydrogenase family protein [Azospirillum oleiclasticum]NYZ19493.1 aldehyde dehydrogenase family protein [Azospirillum oleiclasticum]
MDTKLLIGGRWVDAATGGTIPAIDPSTGETFATIARGMAEDVDAAVAAARDALEGDWGRLSAMERGRLMQRLATLILRDTDTLAEIESRDVGKPLTQARADVVACARYFEFYGGAADKVHGDTIPYQNGYTVMTLREPHGVTGHIVPWNYPLQIVGRSVGGALAMGNACVVKPGEDASLSTLYLAKLAVEAGFPAGSINIVTGYGEEAGAALSAHPGIDHISFTGSQEVGVLVQQAAARNIVPVTLELGGKSPQVVFADADLEQAVTFVVRGAIQNAGQTCSAGSRALVERSIYDRFTAMVAERFAALTVGPALDDRDLGPLINEKQRDRVAGMIRTAKDNGFRVLAEGRIADGAPTGGYYVAPVLFGDVPQDSPLAQQEVFGPALAATPFDGEEEAVRLANGTPFGLVAGVWTRDGGRQLRMAKRIRAGQVFINNYGAGGGVELPFGGMKKSGFNREKGFEALYGFSVVKTVAIKHD